MNETPLPTSYLERYLAPFKRWLTDDDVIELAINPDGRLWIERRASVAMELADQVVDPTDAINLGTTIVGDAKAKVSEKNPLVSGKVEFRGRPLRVQVVVSPAVEQGAAITVRLFGETDIRAYEPAYLQGKAVSLSDIRAEKLKAIAKQAETDLPGALGQLVENRLNILVSGGTSTGKTTFARHLLTHVPDAERLITIEDAFELFPHQPNTVCLLADRVKDSPRSAGALLQASLRMRPDRIVVGELRGPEALTYLEAINTGHGGSVSTIHAETAELAIDRLAIMVLQAGTPLTFAEVQTYISKSIDVIVQLGRSDGLRGIAELLVME
ncbi:ATPase, T2SS/T4P/T4SS family [Aliiroseovarius subalbicans]|uniref:ATPase, T2SS/T4P/T4SS family n=1 Tax=Aliiroseovarius subalbicans TaxID=2925840 RepID=UPI001F5686D5|nr:ATPase, T2SS/T4P/T4SS family [Aliiroseovarius subalbicans]MCI2401005.1 Flp pilus assembly complex ATPase component TadA [Aliiroseovarius subalbicans]